MADAETSPVRPHPLWRTGFWGIAVHLVLFGLLGTILEWDEANAQTLSIFPLGTVGLAKAVALWLHVNTDWIWIVPVAGDLVLLWICWRLAYGQSSSRFSLLFPGAVVVGLASHLSAEAYLVHCGIVQTPRMIYEFRPDYLVAELIHDLWLGFPAGLVLVGQVIRPTRSQTGFCATCGYDLRASKDRCPECGTPIIATETKA